jgi:hypothetical protein
MLIPERNLHKIERFTSYLRFPLGVQGWFSKNRFSISIHQTQIQHYSIYKAANFMAKRRGNPNWGKPEPIGPVIPTVTSFEQAVKEFKLQPDQYIRSTRLREWARRNKNSKYIPETLLEAWGFEIESTL